MISMAGKEADKRSAESLAGVGVSNAPKHEDNGDADVDEISHDGGPA